jgi:hypothetical protein
MICFDVSINGERACLAGKTGLEIMDCLLLYYSTHSEGGENLQVSVAGMDADKTQSHWLENRKLAVGDEITIRIVESESPDPISHEKRFDKQFVEDSERNYYEHMKAKYENEPEAD